MSGIITNGLGEDLGGGGATGFVLTSITPGANQLTLGFASAASLLSGPAAVPSNWTVTGGGAAVTVTAVALSSGNVVLTTTNQTGGASYTLNLPVGVMSFGSGFLGPFEEAFTGVSSAPTIVISRAVDARTVDIVFLQPPDILADALNPAKYSVDLGLAVTAVQQMTATWFRLTTTHQTTGTNYTVTYPV